MGFSAIQDQETATQLLRNVLRRERIPSAFLFWGPEGVGKQMTALEFARAINCREQVDDACGDCLSCRKVTSGNHPDLQVVVPAKRSRFIDTETIGEVIEMASLRPREGVRRIFIIVDADRMHPSAQNRFLKTLEEPPGRSLFILTSHYSRVILPTIRSRCQLVRFRTLRPDTVATILDRERDLTGDVAESIAALAQGQVSRAFDLVDTEKRTVVLAMTQRLADGDDPVLLAEEFTAQLAEQKKRIEAGIEVELNREEKAAMHPEDRERIKQERLAAVEAVCKRELIEYLFLFETWYRDQLVYAALPAADHILNRDQLDRLKKETSTDAGSKIAAVERSRRLLDRFISDERVFRELFLALAAP